MAGDDVAGAVVAVVVVGEAADVDEAFGRDFGAGDEQAEVFDAGDDAVELHADLVGHVEEQLHFLELALGFGGALLAFAAVVAQDEQLIHSLFGLLAAVERRRSAGGW